MNLSPCNRHRQGPAGLRRSGPGCRLPGFRRRSGCVLAEPYPPLKQVDLRAWSRRTQPTMLSEHHDSTFARTAPSTFVRTTTQPNDGKAHFLRGQPRPTRLTGSSPCLAGPFPRPSQAGRRPAAWASAPNGTSFSAGKLSGRCW